MLQTYGHAFEDMVQGQGQQQHQATGYGQTGRGVDVQGVRVTVGCITWWGVGWCGVNGVDAAKDRSRHVISRYANDQ